MPCVKSDCCRNSDGGLGVSLKTLVGMTKATIKNSVEYASVLIEQGKYEDARVFLKNALEGIEILEG